MKTLLLSLLLAATAARAEQWLVNGVPCKGTFHKFNASRTQVYVTSDRDNYRGSWINVASLDSQTRVRLQVATPQEQAAVQAMQAQRLQLDAQALAEAKARVAADYAFQLRQASSPVNVTPVYPQHSYRYSQAGYGYSRTYYPYSSRHHHVRVPYVHVPHVHVPQVHVGRPIVVRVN